MPNHEGAGAGEADRERKFADLVQHVVVARAVVLLQSRRQVIAQGTSCLALIAFMMCMAIAKFRGLYSLSCISAR